MKFVIIQGDGMGDRRETPDQPTPLEAAHTPNMDRLASSGQFGLIHTIPTGYPPGSDVGNLALFGYDPTQCYTGRSPLEAAAMGVKLGKDDVAFRMNLVSLQEKDNAMWMNDFSCGHIASEEAAQLVTAMQQSIGSSEFEFFPGVSYRHLMVWRGGHSDMQATPPHDISDQAITDYWAKGPQAERINDIMKQSAEVFSKHPIAKQRAEQGLKPASMAWLWGQGYAPQITPFAEQYQLKGACISAVDLVRGVATYAQFDIISVPGATGFLDTDYAAKGQYALNTLKDHDLVFVHIEAPDEAGHMGNREEKIRAIESIDQKIIGPMLAGLPQMGPFAMLITSDHATPWKTKTHSMDPVPYAMASDLDLARTSAEPRKYGEADAAAHGTRIVDGYTVMQTLLQARKPTAAQQAAI